MEPPRRDRPIVRALLQATRILEIDGDSELQRRADKHDHTRSIPSASLERLWRRPAIDLRERRLWRLLYETAARADEVLRRDAEDLDIPAKRARMRSKGGDLDWLFFGSDSARLLPRVIAGRRAGPVDDGSASGRSCFVATESPATIVSTTPMSSSRSRRRGGLP